MTELNLTPSPVTDTYFSPLDIVIVDDFFINEDLAFKVFLIAEKVRESEIKELKKNGFLKPFRAHHEIWNVYYFPILLLKLNKGVELEEEKFEGKDRILVRFRDVHDNFTLKYIRRDADGIQEIKFHLSKRLYNTEGNLEYKKEDILRFTEGDFDRGHILYRDVKAYIQTFVDIPECIIVGLTLWCIGTYLYRLFHAYPYLFLHSNKGSGKSRAQRTLANICYKGIIFSNPSLSSLFRTIDSLSPTVFLDEIEEMNRKERQEIINLLNQGYEQGAKVSRINTNTFVPEFFKAYCPKCLASTVGIGDTLQSRAFIVSILKTMMGKKYSKEPSKVIGNELDLNLTFWAIDNGSKIFQQYNSEDLADSYSKLIEEHAEKNARHLQIATPLLYIAQNLGLEHINDGKDLTLLGQFLTEQANISTTESLQSWDQKVLIALYHLTGNEDRTFNITPKQIAEEIDFESDKEKESLNPRKIGFILKRFGFTNKKRLSNGMNYFINGAEVWDRIERYGLDMPWASKEGKKQPEGFF